MAHARRFDPLGAEAEDELPVEGCRLDGAELGGRFLMLERIDEGGMAYVHRALDRVNGQPVAVKVLREAAAREVTVRQRFHDEAEVTRALRSRHIVEIVDVGDRDEPYIAMELLEGVRLDELCGEPLPFEEIYDYLRQITAALEVAHSAGVIHRDLKPENVFIVEREGQRICKVIDFGVAKRERAEALTAAGMVIGTPHYMAPEQASTSKPITPRTDVYALGIILYELVTGEQPFGGFDAMQVMLAQMGLPPPSVRDRRPDCPSELEAIILRCLQKHPAHRFADATELRAALDRAAGDAPTAAERRAVGEEISGLRLRRSSDEPDGAAEEGEIDDRHTPTPTPWVARDAKTLQWPSLEATQTAVTVPVTPTLPSATPPATTATAWSCPWPVAPEKGRRVRLPHLLVVALVVAMAAGVALFLL